jgi:hypothetical protein
MKYDLSKMITKRKNLKKKIKEEGDGKIHRKIESKKNKRTKLVLSLENSCNEAEQDEKAW